MDKAGNFCQPPTHEAFERFCYRHFPELLAEIERLRLLAQENDARAHDNKMRAPAAEAQRDALVAALEETT